LKENSNFLSEPFDDDPLDLDGVSLGGGSFAASLGVVLEGPITQTYTEQYQPIHYN